MRLVKLKDCCTIKPPKSEAKKRIGDDELVSFVPMNNLGIDTPHLVLDENKQLSEVSGSYTYFAENDVLLAKITPCFENGKLGIAKGLTNGIGFGSSEFIVFRTSDELLPEYLYYFLLRSSFRAQGQAVMTGAVGHKRVPKEFIESIEIPLPTVEEQKDIVAVLTQSFDEINRARDNTLINLQNSKELYESLLLGVFNKNSAEWEQVKWGDTCRFIRGPFGGSLKKSMFTESGYVVYEQKHAIHDHFDELRYFVNEDKFNEMRRFEVLPGDIIMSCSGVTLGRVAVVPPSIPKGIINQALLKLTPNKKVNVHFLKYWLRSPIFQRIIIEQSGGAAIPNVPSAKILKDIPFPLPTLIEQEKLVAVIDKNKEFTDKLRSTYLEKLRLLDELKESLLFNAFSGNLTKSKGVAA